MLVSMKNPTSPILEELPLLFHPCYHKLGMQLTETQETKKTNQESHTNAGTALNLGHRDTSVKQCKEIQMQGHSETDEESEPPLAPSAPLAPSITVPEADNLMHISAFAYTGSPAC
jgi:hypothetical protein